MAVNMDKVLEFRMRRTNDMPNIKELAGQKVIPDKYAVSEYTDEKGETHKVLAIRFTDGKYYRTEVTAFIDTFMDYWNMFGEDDDKPAIEIITKNSKRGNPYVNFVIAD